MSTHTPETIASIQAQRMRSYRQRLREGKYSVRIKLTPDDIEVLAEMEYIEPGTARTPAAVRDAAQSFIDYCFFNFSKKKPQTSRK